MELKKQRASTRKNGRAAKGAAPGWERSGGQPLARTPREVHRMKARWSLLLVVGLVSVLLALPAAALAQATGEVEIFSWWAGDEGPALEAIIAEFEKRNPGVRINNATVTGGAGVNAKAVLKTRM